MAGEPASCDVGKFWCDVGPGSFARIGFPLAVFFPLTTQLFEPSMRLKPTSVYT